MGNMECHAIDTGASLSPWNRHIICEDDAVIERFSLTDDPRQTEVSQWFSMARYTQFQSNLAYRSSLKPPCSRATLLLKLDTLSEHLPHSVSPTPFHKHPSSPCRHHPASFGSIIWLSNNRASTGSTSPPTRANFTPLTALNSFKTAKSHASNCACHTLISRYSAPEKAAAA